MKPTLLTLSLLATLPVSALELTSPDLSEGSPMADTFVYNGFGCRGDNRSPALNWRDLPAGTQRLAITAYDPDAPTGSGWWHWIVVNLPVSESGLARGASGQLKAGLETRTDYGITGYGGPCPPKGHGMHRYRFTLWALPGPLTVKADTPAAMIGFQLNQSALASASLTATYTSR